MSGPQPGQPPAGGMPQGWGQPPGAGAGGFGGPSPGGYGAGTGPTKEACSMGLMVHLLAVFTGFLGPLIILLVKGNEDEFIRFHALQSLYWQLVGIIPIMITCGVWAIPMLIFEIIAAIKANDGQWYELPLVGSWARR